jgi:hypothetical protein
MNEHAISLPHGVGMIAYAVAVTIGFARAMLAYIDRGKLLTKAREAIVSSNHVGRAHARDAATLLGELRTMAKRVHELEAELEAATAWKRVPVAKTAKGTP